MAQTQWTGRLDIHDDGTHIEIHPRSDLYGQQTIADLPLDEFYSYEQQQKHAERIVKATNAYPKLVAALREVYEDWSTLTGRDLRDNCEDVLRIDKLVTSLFTELGEKFSPME